MLGIDSLSNRCRGSLVVLGGYKGRATHTQTNTEKIMGTPQQGIPSFRNPRLIQGTQYEQPRGATEAFENVILMVRALGFRGLGLVEFRVRQGTMLCQVAK